MKTDSAMPMDRARPTTVRAARESDWAAVRDLRLRALEEAPLAFGSTLAHELPLDEDEWRARSSRAGHVLAWADETTLVGSAIGIRASGIGVIEGADVHLVGMYVAPPYRGSGCADRLIEAVVRNARADGASRVVLGVTDVNPGAERCYARHGFVRTGRTQPLAHTPQVTEHEMALPLAGQRA